MRLKLSIVTPSYNQARFITEAVESVRDQGYPDVEHLVMDNCSTDATSGILKEYSHLSLVCEPDRGQSDALNKGFRMASGDIVGWLNADDRYLPGCLKAVADFFTAHPDCDILYGNYRLIDEGSKVLCYRQELPFDLFMLKYLHVLYIPSTTTFFRRRIFEDGNFLDIRYHYAMDYEFFLRLALKGYRFSYLPSYLADFRTHADSKSRRQTLVQKEEMEAALLQYDQLLGKLNGSLRFCVRFGLEGIARSKRYVLKLINGAYFYKGNHSHG
ncbi:MAG: glycosyltransferase [Candidatus Omnitrophica bacterium]|nr:glycosyltransferase [Candidatus Omnitrophota bacterium]